MAGPNQLDKGREDVAVSRADMLRVHEGRRTEAGLRENIRVGVRYIQAWLNGRGAVPLYNLMEDAATAEICRAQVWQWLLHQAPLDDGRRLTPALFDAVFADELAGLRRDHDVLRLDEAAEIFRASAVAEQICEFLTLPAYERL